MTSVVTSLMMSKFGIQMTIYGQNEGHFKRENIECFGTGARKKLHKIKIAVFSS